MPKSRIAESAEPATRIIAFRASLSDKLLLQAEARRQRRTLTELVKRVDVPALLRRLRKAAKRAG